MCFEFSALSINNSPSPGDVPGSAGCVAGFKLPFMTSGKEMNCKLNRHFTAGGRTVD